MSHKRTWTLSKVRSGVNTFYNKHNRYPVSRDFDLDPNLPSARHVQRIFGGLVELRKKLKIISEKDFSKGTHSSIRAQKIKKDSRATHKTLLSILENAPEGLLIEQKVPITNGRCSLDFRLSNKGSVCVVEAVNPKDDRTLVECIANKLRKIERIKKEPEKVFIVVMNKKINQEKIEVMEKRKTEPLNRKVVEILSLDSFKERLKKGLLQA